MSQGTIESQPGVDPLILVYGPEHGGRTRGVSSIVGYKKGIKGYVRKKRTYKESQEFEELTEHVQETLMSGKIWDQLMGKVMEQLRKEPGFGKSSVGSTTSIKVNLYMLFLVDNSL